MANTSQETADNHGPGLGVSVGRSDQLEFIQKSLLSDPANLRDLTHAGILLHEMGRVEESAAHLARAMSAVKPAESAYSLSDVHSGILAQMGDCYADDSDDATAERHYRAAIALSPTYSAPYVGLGTIALQADRFEQAREFFETAIEIQDDCGEAYSGLAIIHENQQDYSAAFEMHLKCLELDTNNLVALLGLFQASCEMGTFSKITHYLEIYLGGNPGDTSVLFCLATLYARDGRLQDAKRVTQKILTLEPEKEGAARLLSQLNEAVA
ncbi:MAG: tetratricopeptide repeat protein [Phycisphaerales bacterium]|jgi:tetratricopeptide (TPR) repeat protein|nr:tetratricopeptide repeat protein [Phycisphaerales bacterium]